VPADTGVGGYWAKVAELSAPLPMPIDTALKANMVARRWAVRARPGLWARSLLVVGLRHGLSGRRLACASVHVQSPSRESPAVVARNAALWSVCDTRGNRVYCNLSPLLWSLAGGPGHRHSLPEFLCASTSLVLQGHTA
jgi:hypothetical protein